MPLIETKAVRNIRAVLQSSIAPQTQLRLIASHVIKQDNLNTFEFLIKCGLILDRDIIRMTLDNNAASILQYAIDNGVYIEQSEISIFVAMTPVNISCLKLLYKIGIFKICCEYIVDRLCESYDKDESDEHLEKIIFLALNHTNVSGKATSFVIDELFYSGHFEQAFEIMNTKYTTTNTSTLIKIMNKRQKFINYLFDTEFRFK